MNTKNDNDMGWKAEMDAELHSALATEGSFVTIDNERYYRISNFDAMQAFFISIASDSNLWMYISSTGGLTAGRRNPDKALFPYYTDDKISESAEMTGSKTIIQVTNKGKKMVWEPFSERQAGLYCIERSIAKNLTGNKLIFTEKNHDLGLTFSYKWMNADGFGWIKKSELTNFTNSDMAVYVVDGLQNILPSGIDRQTQNVYSNLVDGYKKTELVEHCGLALFRMESILVDRAEPSESLRANVVWSFGLPANHYLLSSSQLTAIRKGQRPQPELEAKGVRGALFVCSELVAKANSACNWYFVAEIEQDSAQINNLIHLIENTKNIAELLEQDVDKGTQALRNIVGQADGIQQGADEHNMARHFANVLFNTMRGGIYSEGYTIEASFFDKHIQLFNTKVWKKHQHFLASLPQKIAYEQLLQLVEQQKDAQLLRLCYEYLPITFSRRHGDPSRPWNLFDINIKDENGRKRLSYQGNWRDIFQNWEALSLSYPAYVNGIIAKFMNATTADGYNAYRLTNKGIEWEEIEPDNPWSNIGYWGDHQIIYLQKLVEIAHNHFPGELQNLLNKELFVYANVPYRIKSYAEIVAHPKDTILFDHELNKHLLSNEKTYGADAKVIHTANDEPLLVTFTEKLLASLLSKLSNFVPQAGIWLNTQRPEWNDANNALVGSGASMVTVYYLRRMLHFALELYGNSTQNELTLTAEMKQFFDDLHGVLQKHQALLAAEFSSEDRRTFTDEMGMAGQKYRSLIYRAFSGRKERIAKQELLAFFKLTLSYIDQSIDFNKRSDKLYHAYNLLKFTDKGVDIRYLYEMLEGQVAVLSSGKLSPTEAVQLLDALRASALYRPDQRSYILYPNKTLPTLIDKNNIKASEVNRNGLLKELLAKGNTEIITTDKKGQFHFNASFNNVGFLHQALVKLKAEGTFDIDEQDMVDVEEIYEQVFDHQSFTGRSGTFYKYEGLGSIYWHMVSKLLLAIAENISAAEQQHADPNLIKALKHHFAYVKEGIGAHKTPTEYGSFPFDAYSHTPMMAGVQQPGMTGQVKEDIITRYFELGIVVKNGCIQFEPSNINFAEFVTDSKAKAPYLQFTYCNIPFVYQQASPKGMRLYYTDGSTVEADYYQLTRTQSLDIFNRSNTIKKIVVNF